MKKKNFTGKGRRGDPREGTLEVPGQVFSGGDTSEGPTVGRDGGLVTVGVTVV